MCRLEFRFQNLPFSKSAGKKCAVFRVIRRSIHFYGSIRHIFCRFQKVPASSERSLNVIKASRGCNVTATVLLFQGCNKNVEKVKTIEFSKLFGKSQNNCKVKHSLLKFSLLWQAKGFLLSSLRSRNLITLQTQMS